MKRELKKTDIKNAPKKTRSKKYPPGENPSQEVADHLSKPSTKTNKKKGSPRMDESGLTEGQKLFVKIYATDLEFMGNGVYAYSQAFGISIEEKGGYMTCAAGASRLLKQDKILKLVRTLIDSTMNEVMADRELAFLVQQHSDLSVKRAALRDWNELNGRIKQRIENRQVDKEGNDVPVGPPVINVTVIHRQPENPPNP